MAITAMSFTRPDIVARLQRVLDLIDQSKATLTVSCTDDLGTMRRVGVVLSIRDDLGETSLNAWGRNTLEALYHLVNVDQPVLTRWVSVNG